MNLCENIDIKSSAELALGTGEHDGHDVVAAHGLRVLVLEPGDDDGVERVDGRVGDGDERDAVGAHLHGDPYRLRGHGRSLARRLGSRCGKTAAGMARRREGRRGRGAEAGERCASVLSSGREFVGEMAEEDDGEIGRAHV